MDGRWMGHRRSGGERPSAKLDNYLISLIFTMDSEASAMIGRGGLCRRRRILILTVSDTIDRSMVLNIKKTSHIIRH